PVFTLISLTLVIFSLDSRGDIVVTQSPTFLSAPLGGTVKINCKSVTAIDDDMVWYHQRPGQEPKLMIYEGPNRFTGVSDRFSASGYDFDFNLTISNIQAEDAGDFYCQQHEATPLTQ
ncbi:KV5A1 protein, partial [Atractosteus spatula]|nr:KV5A1 protein [Atractosteus spatula]